MNPDNRQKAGWENHSGQAFSPAKRAPELLLLCLPQATESLLKEFARFGLQLEKFIPDWLQRQCPETPVQFPFAMVGKYWDRGQNKIDGVAYQENGNI